MPHNVWIWQTETMTLHSVVSLMQPVRNLRWDPVRCRLAICSGENRVCLWSLEGVSWVDIPVGTYLYAPVSRGNPLLHPYYLQLAMCLSLVSRRCVQSDWRAMVSKWNCCHRHRKTGFLLHSPLEKEIGCASNPSDMAAANRRRNSQHDLCFVYAALCIALQRKQMRPICNLSSFRDGFKCVHSDSLFINESEARVAFLLVLTPNPWARRSTSALRVK